VQGWYRGTGDNDGQHPVDQAKFAIDFCEFDINGGETLVQVANTGPACTIASPQFLENAVQTAMRNSIDLLSMREVTCWRW
jgi:hypothetical protein